MFIFLVDFWMPFPSSECGGIQIVVAQNEDEVVEILCEYVDDYYMDCFPDYKGDIIEYVKKSQRFKLDSTISHPCGLVKEFIT